MTRDLTVSLDNQVQLIEGFGGCFNELGWTCLAHLKDDDRESIFHELFAPGVGANFSLCRTPVGANDFSRAWYSYDEVIGDFALDHFSIANDLETLVPFIKLALRYNPSLRLWASPWSPPSWMKRNGFYAEASQPSDRPPNGIRPEQLGKAGVDMFVSEDRYYTAYANYFGQYIDTYKEQGIGIGMVMPQNEFNSPQPFPSCTWTPESLARFIRYLGPVMSQRGVDVFFGTLEQSDPALLEAVIDDLKAAKYIRGVGVQWAGKDALPHNSEGPSWPADLPVRAGVRRRKQQLAPLRPLLGSHEVLFRTRDQRVYVLESCVAGWRGESLGMAAELAHHCRCVHRNLSLQSRVLLDEAFQPLRPARREPPSNKRHPRRRSRLPKS